MQLSGKIYKSTQNNCADNWQAYEIKINRTFVKITVHLGIVFENKQSKINFISSEISNQILGPSEKEFDLIL